MSLFRAGEHQLVADVLATRMAQKLSAPLGCSVKVKMCGTACSRQANTSLSNGMRLFTGDNLVYSQLDNFIPEPAPTDPCTQDPRRFAPVLECFSCLFQSA
ncbi:hypothetical protein [Saccharopolyspora sp. 5N708]|uniref:hypothetical protein n=1 Tax=Saccharopolyspora sp. 5N708 TaxID=3457424 RepID=UPI003FCF1A74